MSRVIALIVLLTAAAIARAQPAPVAIVNARAYTLESDRPVENATIVLRGGTIEAIGAALAPPAGSRIVDAQGRVVTPALMSAGTQLGLLEIASLPDTRDYASTSPAFGAAFDVQYALNPNSTLLALALGDGLTRAIVHPTSSGVPPFLGQAALVHLGNADALLERARIAMYANPGTAAGTGSRSASWLLLRNALAEARAFRPSRGVAGPRDQLLGRLDAEALQPVVAGRMPLVLTIDRESDIRQAIQLHDDFRVPVIVYGGAEAWRAARELATRRIPVVLDPVANLPSNFDSLGARLDNAARLHAAGVPIAFTASAFHRSYNAGSALRMGAGLAVANGLPWIEGLRAITARPAGLFGLGERYGTLRAGAAADLVLWDGDPLEPATSALQVWVAGVEVPLEDARHRALARRYAPTASRDATPPAYRQ